MSVLKITYLHVLYNIAFYIGAEFLPYAVRYGSQILQFAIKYIRMKKRVQTVKYVAVQHGVSYSKLPGCNGQKHY